MLSAAYFPVAAVTNEHKLKNNCTFLIFQFCKACSRWVSQGYTHYGVRRACILLDTQGACVSWPFPASGGCPHSLAQGAPLPFSKPAVACSVFLTIALLTLTFLLPSASVLHLDNPR